MRVSSYLQKSSTGNSAMPANRDQRFGSGPHFADFYGRNAGIQQRASERAGVFGGNRDEQAAGGLRVEEKRADIGGNRLVVADQAFGKVTIRVEASGNVAGADAIERAFQHRNVGGFEDEADVRCQRHFA